MVCDYVVMRECEVLLEVEGAGRLFLEEVGERPVGEGGAGGLLVIIGEGEARGSRRRGHDVDNDLFVISVEKRGVSYGSRLRDKITAKMVVYCVLWREKE